MTDILMPQMGESIAEGTVTKWLKQVGETVVRDEPLLEISTDKVDAEVPSPASGILQEVRVRPGETVPVNSVLGIVTEGATSHASEALDFQKAVGLPFIEALDSSTTQPLPVAMMPVHALQGEEPPLAEEVAPALARVPDSPAKTTPAEGDEEDVDELRRTRSSPVVRRLAEECGIDISAVGGTGLGGRVTKQDILRYIDEKRATAPPPAAELAATGLASIPPAAAAREPETRPAAGAPTPRSNAVPMTAIRRKTAEHMLASRRISAHATTLFEIDLTRVAHYRERHKRHYFERRGARLSFLPFIVKATIDALKAVPILNASVDGDRILFHKDTNIGIAVALEWGLIVPVIRNADEKNLMGLALAIGDLAERARAKRLSVDEVQGGTFTITNPGVFGSLFGTPIIHQPQVAILAVGAIEKRAVVRDDAIAIRTMAYFALSFDHRVVDGADADHFMGRIKKALEDFDENAE
jgi:pyruvate dehydrogenase E2 component (dihydrolipoamide acetyltransferase)